METDQSRQARTGLSSLEIGDRAAEAVQKTPLRIPLAYMEARIAGDVEYYNPDLYPHLTIAIVALDNGYLLVGKSVPADPENFDRALGQKFAYEDALRHAWPLFAFALRESMTENDVRADLEREQTAQPGER